MAAPYYGTLFERLGASAEARGQQPRELSVSASIASHLARMLRTMACQSSTTCACRCTTPASRPAWL